MHTHTHTHAHARTQAHTHTHTGGGYVRYDAGDVEELCHSQRAVLQPCDEEHEEPKVTGQL